MDLPHDPPTPEMTERWQSLCLLLILLLAAAWRLTGLDWDAYEHYHPDERYIAWVATTVELPNSWQQLAPHHSSFNPFYWPPDAQSEGIVVPQDQSRRFAYGHLPLYLGVAAARVAEAAPQVWRDRLPQSWLLIRDLLNGAQRVEFDHLTAVARALTALVDVAAVAVVFLLGRRMYGPAVGLLAAAFLAVNVMHIQLAHFFTVDPFLTFFTVLAVYAMVAMAGQETRSKSWSRHLVLAAVALGAAVGSKFSAILLFVPLIIALWFSSGQDCRHMARSLLVAIVVSAAVFTVSNPYAIVDWSCAIITPAIDLGPISIPALDWRSCFLDNVTLQSAMIRGGDRFPFTRQYVGTLPYLYPILMQLRWGMGPLLGLAAFGGFGWEVWKGVRSIRVHREPGQIQRLRPDGRARVTALAWTVPYFLIAGAFSVKFMRYMQPLTPFLMVYAAALLLSLRRRWLRRAVVIVVLLATVLYAYAFVSMYQIEHPWVLASRWIFGNAEEGAVIVGERWDESLPSSLPVEGRFRSRGIYEYGEVNTLSGSGEGDDWLKLKANLARLAQADYLSVASNRGYGTVSRLAVLYPLSSQYYDLLFSGKLGFEVVYVTGRSPHIGKWHLWPERFSGSRPPRPPLVEVFIEADTRITWGKADESFTVYDQPMPILFQNKGRLTAEEMLALFEEP